MSGQVHIPSACTTFGFVWFGNDYFQRFETAGEKTVVACFNTLSLNSPEHQSRQSRFEPIPTWIQVRGFTDELPRSATHSQHSWSVKTPEGHLRQSSTQ
jgi:hypothetical protein